MASVSDVQTNRACLPDERPGRAAPPELIALREGIAQATASGVWRTEPPPREAMLGGVRLLRLHPEGPAKAVVVHFHGGGYRLGQPEMTGPYAATLAARCGIDVVCPAYRLAPEHPLPAGLVDGMAVLRALRAESEKPLILAGDSAGGGLAASLTALCIADGMPLAGLILLSAWLDLTVSSPCYDANAASDPLFSRGSAQDAAEKYLQGWSADHPLASPLFAELRGFPPTFVSVGTGEVLAEDAHRFHAALRTANVLVEMSEIPGMEHTAAVRDQALTGAAETFDAAASFIDRLLVEPSAAPRR